MFLKQEKPVMNDFERRKKLVLKEKYFKEEEKNVKIDTLAKISQNIFAHCFVSERYKLFLYFDKKKLF